MISKKRFWGLALPIWEFEDGTFGNDGFFEGFHYGSSGLEYVCVNHNHGYYELPETGQDIGDGIINIGGYNLDDNDDAYNSKDANWCVDSECTFNELSYPVNVNNFLSRSKTKRCRNIGI